MTHAEEFKSLQDFLAKAIVVSLTRSTLFEKHYISLARCISLYQIAYEIGATLGYARGNKLSILNKMLSIQDLNFDNIIKDMQKAEKKRLSNFEKKHGDKPDTFADFIYWPLLESTTYLNLTDLFKPSCTETRERRRKRISDIIQKNLCAKILTDEAESKIHWFLVKGLCFGSIFPELMAKMFETVYVCKKCDEELWSITRKLGFATPIDISKKINLHTTKWRPPSLIKQERIVLGTVAYYTSQYYPELLDPLDLSYYLQLVKYKKL